MVAQKTIAQPQNLSNMGYMEDHSIFYSKSLQQYKNSCQRIHFFSIDPEKVRQTLAELVQLGMERGEEEFRKACENFSREAYLGFSVIKPLDGCPIGRTVIR